MNAFQLTVLAGILAATTGVVMASSGSLNEFKPGFLPVLVQVDSYGKVTDASPATELSPRLRRLLRSNLDEMISKPATDKDGHPVASQVIINLVLKATPNENGRYDAQFAYVSTAPVPSGSWYWVHIDGRRLALAERNSLRPMERNHQRLIHHPTYQRSSQPPVQNATRSTPTPVAAPARTHTRGE